MKKEKRPFVPAERCDTVRQSILSLLCREEVNAMDISEAVGVSVKEVNEHLEHIRHSLHREGKILSILPSECRGCGFVFAKRDRFKRPGRCPVCRGQSISQPRYAVTSDK